MMERRTFLAVLAAPVVPFSFSDEPECPESYYYCGMSEDPGGIFPAEILPGGPDGEFARRWREAQRDRACIQQFVFRPLQRTKRFTVAGATWDGESPPRSLVDPTSSGAADADLWFSDDGWLSRAEALATVAAANAETAAYAAQCGPRGMCYADWLVAVEIGAQIYKPLQGIVVRDGIGCLDCTVQHPVRLIEPTAAERAGYPLDWTPACSVA